MNVVRLSPRFRKKRLHSEHFSREQFLGGGTLAATTNVTSILDAFGLIPDLSETELVQIEGSRNPNSEIEQFGILQENPIFETMHAFKDNINISAGAHNVRNVRGEDGQPIRSKATLDVATRLIQLFGKGKTEEISEDIDINRLQPSISVGGVLASLAFRNVLGWREEGDFLNGITYQNDLFDFANFGGAGIFQDLGDRVFNVAEREKDKNPQPWKMNGNTYDIFSGSRIDHNNFNSLLTLTYIADTGKKNPHLNIAGKNANGTWAALYLLSKYTVQNADTGNLNDTMLKRVQDAVTKKNGFQMALCFNGEIVEDNRYGKQSYPQGLPSVGFVELEMDINQAIKVT